ncbi:alpha-amylase [Aureibacter tunicatorum]|nr:alpha-amylase [Aureibacter tunicatorum]
MLGLGLMQFSCSQNDEKSSASADILPFEQPPKWSQEAVWYQIFPERFANGNTANDPTLHDIEGAWPEVLPDNWRVKSWTSDWYGLDDWEESVQKDFYHTVQMRRYGGDLQGMLDKLDYLEDLGVTALYVNPMNDAPSLHKYDARSYRHIDRNFGNDPKGDEEKIAQEIPDDPSTWVMTSADSMFLEFIDKAHQKGMKVVLDFSWNHTGVTFWAWQDILKNQQNSKYADWYEIESFDDPETDENEFKYTGWAGVHTLPELKKVDAEKRVHGKPYEGNVHEGPKQHIFNVSKRWIDPNGDGDPSDGVDGFRLDVADQVPLGFWRDYRKYVRSLNPEFYLIGEIWWEEWPDKLMNPRPYLQGDIFDAVMHYQWYKPARRFFAQTDGGMTVDEFLYELDSTQKDLPDYTNRAMMNLTSSHDAPRFATSIFNRHSGYKNAVNPRDDKAYKLGKPDEHTKKIQRMMLAHQFTHIGSPQIWNGDELGMWGADDPDNRKPMIWPEMEFDAEKTAPLGLQKNEEEVKADLALKEYIKKLIEVRKNHPVLSYGETNYFLADSSNLILGYRRFDNKHNILAIFNREEKAIQVADRALQGKFEDLLTGDIVDLDGTLEMKELSSMILLQR